MQGVSEHPGDLSDLLETMAAAFMPNCLGCGPQLFRQLLFLGMINI